MRNPGRKVETMPLFSSQIFNANAKKRFTIVSIDTMAYILVIGSCSSFFAPISHFLALFNYGTIIHTKKMEPLPFLVVESLTIKCFD
jgi:hypothetical protein